MKEETKKKIGLANTGKIKKKKEVEWSICLCDKHLKQDFICPASYNTKKEWKMATIKYLWEKANGII